MAPLASTDHWARILLTTSAMGFALSEVSIRVRSAANRGGLSVLALAIVPSVGLAIRIRVEERELLAALGDPYREYAARHRRLVPGIW
jgi:protein-S-isoprenylcysteine O-methyltransferase Ste14